MLDTARTVETPEGVELGLRVAGPVVRAWAWGIDTAFRMGLYMAVGIPLAFFGRVGIGLYLVAVFLLEWFYPVFFEVLRDGSTPGKRRMGIRVLHDDGTPIGWSALAAGRIDDRLPASIPEADPIRPEAPLAFAERQTTWNPQRSAELATVVSRLTGQSGYASHAALLGIANWLLGRR